VKVRIVTKVVQGNKVFPHKKSSGTPEQGNMGYPAGRAPKQKNFVSMRNLSYNCLFNPEASERNKIFFYYV